MRNPELWQVLESAPITLSDGTDLGVVLADRYDTRPVVVAALLTEYRRFLYLSAVMPDPVAPSPAIAQVWGVHRQDAQGWQDYAQRMFGRDPPFQPSAAAPERDPAYLRTLKGLEAEFAITPKAPIWPNRQDFASQNGKAGLVRVLGVAASVGVGWMFGIGYGLLALVFIVLVLPRVFVGTGNYALRRRSDSSDSSGDDGGNHRGDSDGGSDGGGDGGGSDGGGGDGGGGDGGGGGD